MTILKKPTVHAQKLGFALPLVILIVAVLIIAGGTGYYFYLSRDEVLRDKTSQEQKEDEVVKPEQVIDEVVDWKTYQNEEYGYEVKYPKDIRYKEISVSGIEFAYPDQSFTDNTGIYAEMPLHGNASINIQIYKSSLFTDGYLSWVTKRKNINKESEITINGEKFKQVDVVWRLVNGGAARPEGTREIHTFIDKGGMIYDIVYRQPPAGIDKSEDYYQILSTFKFIKLEEVKEGAPKVEVGEEEKPESLIGKYSSPEKTFSFSIKAMEEGDVDAYLESFTEESQETLRGEVASDYLKRMAGLYKETEFKVIEKNSDMAVMAIMTLEKTILPSIFIFKKEKGDWKIDFKEQFFSSLYEEEIKKSPILHRLEEIKEEARSQARDGKRAADLMQLWPALELYFSQYGGYPVLTDTSEDGEFLKVLVDEGYFSQMFLDPQHPEHYYEYNGTRESFILKCYIEEEGGIIDMKDGVKDNAYTITSPK